MHACGVLCVCGVCACGVCACGVCACGVRACGMCVACVWHVCVCVCVCVCKPCLVCFLTVSTALCNPTVIMIMYLRLSSIPLSQF